MKKKLLPVIIFLSLINAVQPQNVGISTSTPQSKLHIFRGASGYVGAYPHQDIIIEGSDHTWIQMLVPDNKETGMLFGKASNIVSGGIVYDINNNLHFRTGGNTDRVNIDASGVMSFPAVLGSKITLYPGAEGNVGFGVQGNLFQIFSDYPGADIGFGYGTSSSFTENMRVRGNGNVGVGKIPNNFKFEIAGDLAIALYKTTNTASHYGNIYSNTDTALVISSGVGIVLGTPAKNIILNPPPGFPFTSGNVGMFTTDPTAKLHVNGVTMIGSGNPATGYQLCVNGKVICTEAKVQLNSSWPDYVFSDNYKLLPLNELEKFIKENLHLPNIPRAVHIEKNGLEIGDMIKRLTEKIEELTLYIIELKKENEGIKKEINQLNKKN